MGPTSCPLAISRIDSPSPNRLFPITMNNLNCEIWTAIATVQQPSIKSFCTKPDSIWFAQVNEWNKHWTCVGREINFLGCFFTSMSVTFIWLLFVTDITTMHNGNYVTVTSTKCKDGVTCYVCTSYFLLVITWIILLVINQYSLSKFLNHSVGYLAIF